MPSWLSACSLPLASVASRSVWCVGGRWPVVVNISSRGTTSCTGRPTSRAAAAAATACGQIQSLLPKPEPMNGDRTSTRSGGMPKTLAITLRAKTTPCEAS